MSNNLQILEFEFEAHAESVEDNADNVPPTKKLEVMVNELNYKSDEVAQQIQQELRRTLPPRVRVEVDIQFFKGSLTAIGTVILLFLQPIVLEAGKQVLAQSFEAGFTRIIQFAVRRILSRHLKGIPLGSPLEVDVQPLTEDIETSQTNTNVPATITAASPTGSLGYLLPLTAANTFLLIVLIIVAASRILGLLP